MSLEEFFNDNTLGDSVWDEEEINLDAISISSPLTNTTSLDVLKQGPVKLGGPTSEARGPMGRGNVMPESGGPRMRSQPYIVKFSHLPSKFTRADIEDLFHTKCTRYSKLKLFWELNKKPPIGLALKNTGVFELNFTRDSKVAFTELYSARDMDKILDNWSAPLRELFDIYVTPAQYDDFQHYMAKTKLLSEADDPGLSYDPQAQHSRAQSSHLQRDSQLPPQQQKREPKHKQSGPGAEVAHGSPQQSSSPKKNPFGHAKPVDTQTKILQIEQTVNELHIEDTKKLRRASQDGHHGTAMAPQPISYSAILKKSVLAATPAASPHFEPAKAMPSVSPEVEEANSEPQDKTESDEEATETDGEEVQPKSDFVFKTTGREDSHGHERSSHHGNEYPGRGGYRGGRGDRGGGSYRGRGRGGTQGRGGFSNKKFDDTRHKSKFNNGRDENPYSAFRPASGFLREGPSPGSSRGGRGGRGGHGNGPNERGRGGYRNNRHGFTSS
ncbi:LAMI_0D12046g1_1 [Lachancea mirantina]|uniref:LAMI_0D12046g1_1 n=1 Tax=Lachancea mirantina TaxID=1230905 RepID=A0A1G4JG07_9SACH|nr:LAMI_0D12046g1_1 [Lachancea mirantina]